MVTKFVKLELKPDCSYDSQYLGMWIVENPFREDSLSSVPVIKNETELNYLMHENYQQMSRGSNQALVDYEIVSYVNEFKQLTKSIPENTIVTTQHNISTLIDGGVPE
jgi:hypothetical protein